MITFPSPPAYSSLEALYDACRRDREKHRAISLLVKHRRADESLHSTALRIGLVKS